MTDTTRAWLKELQGSIWRLKRGVRWVGCFQEEYDYHDEARRLTPEEWVHLEGVLRDERPVVDLVNSGFGFGCAMRVFDDPIDSPYPGVPPIVPDLLLVVDKNHLPLEGRTMEVQTVGRKTRTVPADRTSFEDGWVAFSPFTHDPENARRLVACGLEAPREKSHYEY